MKRLAERDALAGAVDLRVGGQDLLDQRRAGARHAHDEHRRGIVIAGPRPSCSRVLLKAAMDASTKARCASRENGWNCFRSLWPSRHCAMARSGAFRIDQNLARS